MKSKSKPDLPTLRQKAEKLAKMRPSKATFEYSVYEMQRLIRELEIHQIELELQNEALFQSKEQTENSKIRYSELYDFAPSGYFTLNREGEILEANLYGAQILGKERLYLTSERFDNFVNEETLKIYKEFLQRVFKSKKRESCEVILATTSNRRLYAQLNGVISENSQHCLLTVADISGIKEAKEALFVSEEKHRNNFILLNSILESPTSIIIFSLDTNYCYTAFTKFHHETILKIWGVDIQIGMNILEVISSLQDREKARKNFDRALSGEYFIVTEEYGDQTLIRTFYEDYYSPLKDYKGKIIGLSVFVIDITERESRNLEIKLKNEELQKLNAEKDKFFSIISHDLRTPFNGFLGLTEMMADGLSRMTLDEIQSLAILMKESASNLYRLLGNLLEWSKMQRGLANFAPVSIILLSKITECCQNSHEAARKKEIDFQLDIPAGLTVIADVHMFESIMRNLCYNAVKFTPKKGKVTISAKSNPDNLIKISIKDTGIGMSPEILGHLFSLDISTNRKGTDDEPSTGLGLILCKDFIEKHGGKLKIKSKPEKGSTFSFMLPQYLNY